MSIKNKLINNTIWCTIERLSIMGIQLMCTFILARYLEPKDFGLIGMLAVFTTISNTIIDSGFMQALIRDKNVNSVNYSTVFYFNFLISTILYFILFLSSSSISNFFNEPILENICKITFLIIPLNGISIVQNAILMRNLEFKKLCISSVLASTISGLIAIIYAYFRKDVWAIVYQNLFTYILKTFFLLYSTKWYPTFNFSFSIIKKYFSFSKNLLFSGLLGNVFNNLNNIIIGKYYTTSDLGYYSQAERLKNVTSYTLISVIQTVTFPILSKINNEDGDVKYAYKKIITITFLGIGFITSLLMPICADLFEILMGEKWRIAGNFFFLLSINGMLFPLHSINQNILLVKGKSNTILKLELIRRTLFLIIILITVNFNIYIFVLGSVIYSITVLFLNIYVCGKPINYLLKEQLSDLLPSIITFIVMICIGIIITRIFDNTNIYYRIIVSLLTTFLTGILLLSKNKTFKYLVSILKNKFLRMQNA